MVVEDNSVVYQLIIAQFLHSESHLKRFDSTVSVVNLSWFF
jgi:hypothetical protein